MADINTTKVIEITAANRQELLDELERRTGEIDAEIVASLQEARSFGDLAENAEFDAAREEQAKNAARINEIRKILATAKVVEDAPKKGRKLTVSINTTAELEDESGKTVSFTIVGTTNTNSLEHKISSESPLGEALIGHKKGDEIEYVTPSGRVKRYKIKGITVKTDDSKE